LPQFNVPLTNLGISSTPVIIKHNSFSTRVIIIIDSAALGGPLPSQANVASNLYPRHHPPIYTT
jgi:hypothetical protein